MDIFKVNLAEFLFVFADGICAPSFYTGNLIYAGG